MSLWAKGIGLSDTGGESSPGDGELPANSAPAIVFFMAVKGSRDRLMDS